jgi:cytochrome P450
MLGVPEEDRKDFRRWTNDVVSSETEPGTARPAALAGLHGLITGLIDTRRADPGDDLLSALIAAGDEDDALTGAELVAMVFLLLLAGHETTVGLIGNGVLALLAHPDQLALLRERRDLLGAAVEEILRYDGPVEMATWRFATEPVEIAGTTVPAGQPILLALASAGRDPARYDEPDRLDLTRENARHLAFGHGLHYCVGAALARLEGEVALATILDRLPGLTLTVPAARLRRRRSLTMRGPAELPVTFG